METAALIIVLGSTVLAAGIAFGAAWLAGRYIELPFREFWLAAAGGLAGLAVSLSLITGWPASLMGPGTPEPLATVLPYISAFEKKDPAMFERLVTLIQRDQQDGRSREDVRSNARALAMSYAADRTPMLPDDLVYELYTFTRDELAFLDRTGNHKICADVALGRIRGDIDTFLSPELSERFTVIMRRIVMSPVSANAPRMGAEPFTVMASQAFAAASQATGIPPNEIDPVLAGSAEPAKACRLMKGFFDAMLSHPVTEAASALRQMASGERGSR
jgi:hypothetical protein